MPQPKKVSLSAISFWAPHKDMNKYISCSFHSVLLLNTVILSDSGTVSFQESNGVSSVGNCRYDVIKNASDAVIRIGLPTAMFTNVSAQGTFRSLISCPPANEGLRRVLRHRAPSARERWDVWLMTQSLPPDQWKSGKGRSTASRS